MAFCEPAARFTGVLLCNFMALGSFTAWKALPPDIWKGGFLLGRCRLNECRRGGDRQFMDYNSVVPYAENRSRSDDTPIDSAIAIRQCKAHRRYPPAIWQTMQYRNILQHTPKPALKHLVQRKTGWEWKNPETNIF
ncbi:hypothetical protein B2G52_01565 [Neisseria lactamica]|uniref:Uncharacterized protein n=1 Tax=Neisseria lactamica TaxID=486 RepID=A0AAU8VCD4_NEILA|nr:hypothetical protein B2G52_01565 [Neisseria lactamica]